MIRSISGLEIILPNLWHSSLHTSSRSNCLRSDYNQRRSTVHSQKYGRFIWYILTVQNTASVPLGSSSLNGERKQSVKASSPSDDRDSFNSKKERKMESCCFVHGDSRLVSQK